MLKIYRLANWFEKYGVPIIPRLLFIVNRAVFAVVLPPTVSLDRGVVLGYSGLGIVIHARAAKGNNVIVGPKVTIGGRSGVAGMPAIEDDVVIVSSACILGPVRIGRGARIGTNVLVRSNVPARIVSRAQMQA